MALLRCAQCGHQVSTDAKSCPGCGAPAPRRTSRPVKLLAAVLVGGVVISGIGSMTTSDRPTQPPTDPAAAAAKAAAAAADTIRIRIARAVWDTIRQNAREPESLKAEFLGVSPDGKRVCAQLRGKNGFGGYERVFYLYEGNTVAPATSANWSKKCVGLVDYLAVAG